MIILYIRWKLWVRNLKSNSQIVTHLFSCYASHTKVNHDRQAAVSCWIPKQIICVQSKSSLMYTYILHPKLCQHSATHRYLAKYIIEHLATKYLFSIPTPLIIHFPPSPTLPGSRPFNWANHLSTESDSNNVCPNLSYKFWNRTCVVNSRYLTQF